MNSHVNLFGIEALIYSYHTGCAVRHRSWAQAYVAYEESAVDSMLLFYPGPDDAPRMVQPWDLELLFSDNWTFATLEEDLL